MVSAPQGNKCGEVMISQVEGDTVISVPAVEDSFLFTRRDGSYLMEETLFGGFPRWHGGSVPGSQLCGEVCLSFFAQTTMRWHQLTGSPTGTGSRTPRDTSLSRPALTSCQ